MTGGDIIGDRTDAGVRQQAQWLLNYDISLPDGLSFVSGNLSQYQAIAGIFLTHTADISQSLRNLAAEGDYRSFARTVHSLKSQAGLVGAGELAALARRLEEKCAAKQTDYLEKALPLLLYELDRTRQGLAGFLANVSAASEQSPPSPALLKEELLVQAATGIANYQRTAGREALTRLHSLEEDEERRRFLQQIKTAVDELDFEEADELFQAFCRLDRKGADACDNQK